MANATEPHLLLSVVLVRFEGLSTVRCASFLPIAPQQPLLGTVTASLVLTFTVHGHSTRTRHFAYDSDKLLGVHF